MKDVTGKSEGKHEVRMVGKEDIRQRGVDGGWGTE